MSQSFVKQCGDPMLRPATIDADLVALIRAAQGHKTRVLCAYCDGDITDAHGHFCEGFPADPKEPAA